MKTLQDLIYICTTRGLSVGWCSTADQGMDLIRQSLSPTNLEQRALRYALECCTGERTEDDGKRRYIIHTKNHGLTTTPTPIVGDYQGRITQLGRVYEAAFKRAPAPLAQCNVGDEILLFRRFMYAFALPLSAFQSLAEHDANLLRQGINPDRKDCFQAADKPLDSTLSLALVKGEKTIPIASFQVSDLSRAMSDMVSAVQQLTGLTPSYSARSVLSSAILFDAAITRKFPLSYPKTKLWAHNISGQVFVGDKPYLNKPDERPYRPLGYFYPRMFDQQPGTMAQFFESDYSIIIIRNKPQQ